MYTNDDLAKEFAHKTIDKGIMLALLLTKILTDVVLR